MRVALSILIAVHGLIHLMGFAKAFELASLEALRLPVSRPAGVVWLVAALLLLGAATALLLWPRGFWWLGAAGLATSQVLIVMAWSDARFGTVANVIGLAAVAYGAFAWGPFGLRAEYEARVREALTASPTSSGGGPIAEADLAPLPAPVQRYLRHAGVVGTPRVRGFRARMTGRIRSAADAPWMPFQAEQHNLYDPPRRFFWMEATRAGLPVDGLHAYDDRGASMRVRLLSMIPVVDVRGPEMTRTETVTVLNDICLFAPGRLLDPAIRWRELDSNRVLATYVNGPNTVRATLVFDDTGALVDFVSDDRPSLAEDGVTLLPQRWSTPIGGYRAFGPYRLLSRGRAVYEAPEGPYAYIEIEVTEVTVNPTVD